MKAKIMMIAVLSILGVSGTVYAQEGKMTGEITLRGLVLPVGGIKQKVLAAKRAGIKNIILPKLNEKDLEDVPESIKENMDFKFIEKMDEAISITLATP